MGVIRTPTTDPLAAVDSAALRTEFTALIAEFEPDCRRGRAGVLSGQRAHGHERTGQASGLALAEAAMAGL